MHPLLILVSVSTNLVVLGAHVAVPWQLTDAGTARRQRWALVSLPLLLLAALLTLLRYATRLEPLLDAGFGSPLWAAPPAQALALLFLSSSLTDGFLLIAAPHLKGAGWRLVAGVGVVALVGFSYFAESLSPIEAEPPLRLARALLRTTVSIAAGTALAPGSPSRSRILSAGAVAVIVYLLLVPLDALLLLWSRGDLLLALTGAALLLSPRLFPPQPGWTRWSRPLVVAAALALGGFWTRVANDLPSPLVSSASHPRHLMTSPKSPHKDQVGLKLPLFPLPNVVHFPRTELRLHVFEQRYRSLVSDLLSRDEGERWIGMVLLRPDARGGAPNPPIFRAGTAGRMDEVEPLEDGRSNIVLHGGFRFEVESELGGRPYRQASVRIISEPPLQENDPGVVALRRELLETGRSLAGELGERFPLSHHAVQTLGSRGEIETIVNAFAAHLDLPALRKLQLLAQPLPERALSVLGILRSRQKVLDLLRPFRHLAAGIEYN